MWLVVGMSSAVLLPAPGQTLAASSTNEKLVFLLCTSVAHRQGKYILPSEIVNVAVRHVGYLKQ